MQALSFLTPKISVGKVYARVIVECNFANLGVDIQRREVLDVKRFVVRGVYASCLCFLRVPSLGCSDLLRFVMFLTDALELFHGGDYSVLAGVHGATEFRIHHLVRSHVLDRGSVCESKMGTRALLC